MGGGLMQLVAYGAQDIYLTGNPQITFFKVVYRRHTNFSTESIVQTFNGTATSGGRQTATISRNGDLISRMYLQFKAAKHTTTGAQINPGTSAIKEIELEIGGQLIDKQRGDWMEAWAELTEPNPSAIISASHSSGTKYQNLAKSGGVYMPGSSTNHDCIVPLSFWFCRNPGLALPLIALQYHEVKIIVNWQTLASGVAAELNGLSEVELWVDYIYLDTDERRRFAQVSHEYLIEQVQHQTSTKATNDLVFNHPVKELVWFKTISASGVRDGLDNTGKYKLSLNGHDRFAERPLNYFTKTQVWEHHTGCPLDLSATPDEFFISSIGTQKFLPKKVNTFLSASLLSGVNCCDVDSGDASLVALSASSTTNTTVPGSYGFDAIAVYSFALKPEEHQPSGTCNFSRIDNAQLKQPTAQGIEIFAVNYNVLRIMSGMGGLAYSN